MNSIIWMTENSTNDFFWDSTLWSEKTARVLFCLKKATIQEGQESRISQESAPVFLGGRHSGKSDGKMNFRFPWLPDFSMPWGFKDGVSEIDEEAFSATVGEFFPRGPDTEGFTPQYVVAGVAWSNWLQDFWGWKVKTNIEASFIRWSRCHFYDAMFEGKSKYHLYEYIYIYRIYYVYTLYIPSVWSNFQ